MKFTITFDELVEFSKREYIVRRGEYIQLLKSEEIYRYLYNNNFCACIDKLLYKENKVKRTPYELQAILKTLYCDNIFTKSQWNKLLPHLKWTNNEKE